MITAAELFADLMRRPRFRAEYASLEPEFREAARQIKRTQKSPRGAGRFAMIGASTRSACNTLAGDFRNLVEEEPKMQRIYSGTRARVCHPVRRPSALAFRLGGGA